MVSPSSGTTPVQRLRDAVAARAAATSVRQVAREVGLSPRGLQKFLDGSVPYSATRRKLERWFVQASARRGEEPGRDAAEAALRVLVQGLPPQRQDEAVHRLLAAVEEVYRAAGTPMPAWAADVRVREGE